jgi:hypothetical protein
MPGKSCLANGTRRGWFSTVDLHIKRGYFVKRTIQLVLVSTRRSFVVILPPQSGFPTPADKLTPAVAVEPAAGASLDEDVGAENHLEDVIHLQKK